MCSRASLSPRPTRSASSASSVALRSASSRAASSAALRSASRRAASSAALRSASSRAASSAALRSASSLAASSAALSFVSSASRARAVVFFFAKTVRRPDSPAQTFQCCVSPAWTCLCMCQGVNRLVSLPRLGRCCAQLLQVLVLRDNQQLPVQLLLRGVLVEALRPQERPGLRREAASEQPAVMRYRAKHKIHFLDICCATVLPAAAAGVAIAGSPPVQTSGTEVSRRRRCGCVCSMR